MISVTPTLPRILDPNELAATYFDPCPAEITQALDDGKGHPLPSTMGNDNDRPTQIQRQNVFQKLRPVCVELNTTIIRFKAKGATVKDVLHALEAHYHVLVKGEIRDYLSVQLAEYNRVPLFEVFNEAQRLSARCLEVAVKSFTIIISYGWRKELNPDLGKQLLILMSLLAGGGPSKTTLPASDELSAAAFDCMSAVMKWSASSEKGTAVYQGQATKSVIDTLGYLLVENLTNSPIDFVQIAAANVLLEIYLNLKSRVLLASILPRTLSALAAVLKPSTQSRRTHQVLCTNLHLLRVTLERVLADNVALVENLTDNAEKSALDASWLKATSPQVRNCLVQIVRLRSHERLEVRQELSKACVTVIEECSRTLGESVPVMLETLVILSGHEDDSATASILKHLVVSRPELSDMLRSNFYDWTKSLPRIMQGNDDRPREVMLSRITNTFNLINETTDHDINVVNMLTTTILNSVAIAIARRRIEPIQVQESSGELYTSPVRPSSTSTYSFDPVLLNHQSERSSSQQLQKMIENLKHHPAFGNITRTVIDTIASSTGDQRLSAAWLALKLLEKYEEPAFHIEDLIAESSIKDRGLSRTYLIHDLYSFTKDYLINALPYSESEQDWRLTALSLEALIMQARQLGIDYRNELYETLYPVLAHFSSKNSILQNHAVTCINYLATACQYSSAKEMLLGNVDYLVNSIAWKLNTFNLSPEAPQVLNMILRLVGAGLIPYLDDMISSIFTALDSYHGYTQWVEMLFAVLKTMVDESTKQPSLALTEGRATTPSHKKVAYQISTISAILSSLQARKKRKLDMQSDDTDGQEPAPHRPWSKSLDDPTYVTPPKPESEDISLESLLKESQEEDNTNPLPPPKPSEEEEDLTKPLTKSHSLLLKIAESTVPHLSSPSPQVRHLLLQLLVQISPLLAQHENTFLPLINAIWPGLTTRLFANSSFDSASDSKPNPSSSSLLLIDNNPDDNQHNDTASELETNYNIITAVELVQSLCLNAGDFMSSRITSVLPHLLKLSRSTSSQVRAHNARNRFTITNTSIKPSATTISKSTSTPAPALLTSPPLSSSSKSQLLTSLLKLNSTILSHVTLSLDQADEIFTYLAPYKDGYGDLSLEVREAIEGYNLDWVRVLDETGRDEE